MSMALFSSSPTHLPALPSSSKTLFLQNLPSLYLPLAPKRRLVVSARASANVSGPLAAVEDQQVSEASAAADSKPKPAPSEQESLRPNFSPPPAVDAVANFEDSRWANGTWDLNQFQKDGKTNWDAVIDAEVKRRKWFEDNPESTSNDNPIVFDTSIIPWWAWMKRFHLPEAELLNGRAAMIGFFMAYLVDSLTGVGLVDQMGNFFCKTLLFVAVAGVLLIRKNEDIEALKKLVEETTFYDKQWQATWQDEKPSSSEKN